MLNPIARCLTAASILALVSATPAHAGQAHAHDGLFLRLSAGGGFAGSRIGVGDATRTFDIRSVDLSGATGDVNLAIGAVIHPNLALHATLFGWSVRDPDAEITVTGLGMATGTLEGTSTLSGIGPGVTYYFMPANVYVSGTAGIGRLKLTGDVEGETRTDFAMDFTVGKEWWASNAWGLGIAGGVTYHSLRDKDVSDHWAGTSYALRFSATMN